MELLFFILGALVVLFGFVVFMGAPYLPTHKSQVAVALGLLDLRRGQTLLELGAGDGSLTLAAAKRGIKVEAYEINPLLWLLTYIRTIKYRSNVRVHLNNYWTASWPVTDGIYVFLLDKYMRKLDKKIVQTYEGKPVKLVSYSFQIPAKKSSKIVRGMYLYRYK